MHTFPNIGLPQSLYNLFNASISLFQTRCKLLAYESLVPRWSVAQHSSIGIKDMMGLFAKADAIEATRALEASQGAVTSR